MKNQDSSSVRCADGAADLHEDRLYSRPPEEAWYPPPGVPDYECENELANTVNGSQERRAGQGGTMVSVGRAVRAHGAALPDEARRPVLRRSHACAPRAGDRTRRAGRAPRCAPGSVRLRLPWPAGHHGDEEGEDDERHQHPEEQSFQIGGRCLRRH
jgi:hypothetical protein